jgi:hypothetical protein
VQCGVFGVPTFFVDSEMFFGNDRINIHAQSTVVEQAYPSFRSPYEGTSAAGQRRTLRRGLAGWLNKSPVQNSFGLTSRCRWKLTFSQWRSSLCGDSCGPSQARRSDAHKTKSAPT